MNPGLQIAFILLLVLPAGVIADPGDSYPGMMADWQNGTGPYGPGMMADWQNGTGPYGPGMMVNWQNGTGPYGPGVMANWQNTPVSFEGCPAAQYGMMNGWGYGNNGRIMGYLMGFVAILGLLFILVWTIAGILLIIWLYRQVSAK